MKHLSLTRPLYVFLAGMLFFLGMNILISGGSLRAQTYLVIEKPGKVKNFKLKPGSTLHYRLSGQKTFRSGTISRLTDSIIFLNEGARVPLNSIDAIKMDQVFMQIMSGFTAIAGVGYISLDVFNNLINNIGPVFNQQTMIISGSLIASALIFRMLSTRTLRMGNKWRLKVIDMDNPPLLIN